MQTVDNQKKMLDDKEVHYKTIIKRKMVLEEMFRKKVASIKLLILVTHKVNFKKKLNI